MRPMILAGDIGGTKTLLGLFTDAHGPRQPLDLREYPTRTDLPPQILIEEFLEGREPRCGVIGVAGAVLDGAAEGSNLPWAVRQEALERVLGAPVRLVNDLEAIANWVPHLEPGELHPLQEGRPQERAPIGVIAPGTGMGEAILVWQESEYRALPSEAGHVDFAPGDELQDGYLRFLRERFGHVSLERACSGASMPLLLEHLVAEGRAAPAPAVRERLAAAADPTPVIVGAALEQECAACRLALETFVDMLGAAAGNLALQIVALGGIVLAGGVVPRILPLLDQRFLRAFRHKGRFAELMHRIPVRALIDDRAALRGAAAYGLSRQPR